MMKVCFASPLQAIDSEFTAEVSMYKTLIILFGGAFLLGANAHAVPRGELLGSTCLSCHGPGGKSKGAVPNLAGLDKRYFVKAMQDFKSGVRPGSIMKRHASGYTDDEFDQMGEYFSKLK